MPSLGHLLRQVILLAGFKSSQDYWEQRYRLKGDSGSGSYGELALFKAEVLNGFVREHGIQTVAEFGCGDGEQLSVSEYPDYLGLDVSKKAIEICSERFKRETNKSFIHYDPLLTLNLEKFFNADLVVSLDVIYHLVEDNVYKKYLSDLFSISSRYVIIYSSDDENITKTPHVRHRNFTPLIESGFPEYRLMEVIGNRYPDQSHCSFFLYERIASPAVNNRK